MAFSTEAKISQGFKPDRLTSFTVGGIRVSSLTRYQALEQFFYLAGRRTSGFITVTSAHGIVESQSDPHLRAIINNGAMTVADGIPLLWVGKLKGAAVERFTGTDFLQTVLRDRRATLLRHYFYGGQSNSTLRLVANARELLGKSAIAGYHCPPLRAAGAREEASTIAEIAATAPDVIWVGLSTPKQDYWMAQHTSCFPNSILVGVGAAFDFLAGVRPRAPKFIQQMGFEWLFRLAKEPERLWPRYRKVVPGMLKILIVEAAQRSGEMIGICREHPVIEEGPSHVVNGDSSTNLTKVEEFRAFRDDPDAPL